ncbi:MAG: GDSL-type esterase/lipase family protein [Fimbriimonas sp.]
MAVLGWVHLGASMPVQGPQLRNGGFEFGTPAPTGWVPSRVTRGQITLTRDTKLYRLGQSSMKMTAVGNAHGRVVQRLAVGNVRKFGFSGMLRTEGRLIANVFVLPYDAGGRALEFQQVHFQIEPRDWEWFAKTVQLPPNATSFDFGLILEGDGEGWMDGLQIVPAEGSDALPIAPIPDLQDPILPYPGTLRGNAQAWLALHRRYRAEAKIVEAKVVFLGDSITEMWDSDLWKANFGPYRALNFGIRGDRTNQVLWRLKNGTLDGLDPRLVVVAVGANNLWKDRFGAKRVAQGAQRIIAEIRRQKPKSKVLLLAVLPNMYDPQNPFRKQVEAMNRELSAVARQSGVRFTDLGKGFLEPDGSISKEVMFDGLHLTPSGYRILANGLSPIVYEMVMGKPGFEG